MFKVGDYVIEVTGLRARVTEVLADGRSLRCITADIRDAGTRFVASAAVVRPCEDPVAGTEVA